MSFFKGDAVNDDEQDDVTDEVEEPRATSGPKPPYGGNIPARWRNTPFDELPENLQRAVKES